MSIDKRVIFNGEKRICSLCKEEKDLVNDFQFSVANNCFTESCKRCINLRRNNRRKIRNRSYEKNTEKDNELRNCRVCDVVYRIVDGFHLHKSSNCYLRTCRKCINKERKRKRDIISKGGQVEDKRRKSREFTSIDKAKMILRFYNSTDKKKGFNNDLDLSFIINSITKACTYCGFVSTGLDRIDNSIGHTKINSLPCCRECNIARNHLFTHEEAKIIGKAIKFIKEQRIMKILGI